MAGAGGPAPLCDPYGLDSLVSSLHGPGDALSQPLPPPAADRYQDDFSPPEYGDGFPADLTAGGMAYSPIRSGTARLLIIMPCLHMSYFYVPSPIRRRAQ